tara:strand:- start:234 stop:665 length:432 start_codon:yes stop_codon:yes gene_type:complete
MSGTLKIAGTTLATNPTNSKVEIDDAVSGKGIAKAWVKFDGSLELDNTAPETAGDNMIIRASHNVQSVQWDQTGVYTVNLVSGAVIDEHYCVVTGGKRTDSNSNEAGDFNGTHSLTVNSFKLMYVNINGISNNQINAFAAIFR